MSERSFSRRLARTLACLAGAAGAALSVPAPAAAQPVPASEIVQSALQGFGDRYNSQAWSMAWWKDKLYVGTGRATYCIQQATLVYFDTGVGSYPPGDDDTDCTPDAHDLPLQAEIWAWTPETDTWEMLYRAPNDVPIAGTNPLKFTARDVGYRGMLVFREADGTEALYVSGVTSRGAQGSGFNGPVPPPRLLRSVDGVTFNPVPQNPGTVLGDTTVTGFRSMVSYKGRLYVLASIGLLGHGIVYEAANPEQGDNAFCVITPPGKTFFEIDKYHGYLFLGTGVQPALDPTPFSLLKTNATGNPYIYRAVASLRALQPPPRLAAETLRRAALLSWEPSPTAARYHIWRDVGYADPEEIAVIDATALPVQMHLDTTIEGFKQYHYQLVAEDALGQLSDPPR